MTYGDMPQDYTQHIIFRMRPLRTYCGLTRDVSTGIYLQTYLDIALRPGLVCDRCVAKLPPLYQLAGIEL